MGSLTTNVAEGVRAVRAGRLEYRVDRDGNLLAAVGKVGWVVVSDPKTKFPLQFF